MQYQYSMIRWFVLNKLVRRRIWQHKHTSIHNLAKGLPLELRQSKIIKKVIEDLLKKGFLLSKPTNYGLEVSLNIRRKKEIEEIVNAY